jgi:hypothetical protein
MASPIILPNVEGEILTALRYFATGGLTTPGASLWGPYTVPHGVSKGIEDGRKLPALQLLV